MRRKMKQTNKKKKTLGNEVYIGIKSLIDFYTYMLKSGRVTENGPAHNRLKELEFRYKNRKLLRLKVNKLRTVKNFTKKNEKDT